MQRIRRKGGHPNKKLRNDLLALYDGLTEFSDHCAFFCDAFAAITTCEETIDPATARGISLSAQWMKSRVQEIQLDLKKIHDQARSAIR